MHIKSANARKKGKKRKKNDVNIAEEFLHPNTR
jgi:hypothetical protein